MFARFSAAVVLALPIFAAASAIPRDAAPNNQCNTGPIQCCNSLQQSSKLDYSTTSLLTLLGVVVGDITGQVGANCSPVTIIGGASNSCTQQPVCCTNNSFNGVVAIGCSPINVGL